MQYDVKVINEMVQKESAFVDGVLSEVGKVIVGQRYMVERVLIGLITGGHVLLEGVPGLGKTLLVKALAAAIGGKFSRIQFTPDLMPSDVTGHAMYEAQTSGVKLPAFTAGAPRHDLLTLTGGAIGQGLPVDAHLHRGLGDRGRDEGKDRLADQAQRGESRVEIGAHLSRLAGALDQGPQDRADPGGEFTDEVAPEPVAALEHLETPRLGDHRRRREVDPRSRSSALGDFDRAAQAQLIEYGKARLSAAGVERIRAFRAGGYALNANTLTALAENAEKKIV